MATIKISVKENTATGSIIYRVKTFEDACAVVGIKGDIFDGVLNDTIYDDEPSITAYTKLIIIAKALNEGWQPDWEDSSQRKYVPWFKHKSGFGLSYDDCDTWHTFTVVGSRLCYKSEALAKYAATQFADIYNDYLTIK